MIGCCLWCLEKILKFINKNAYIITAIYGYGFCSASRKAFWLLLRNILRVSAVGIVSTLLLLIGRIFIPLATTVLCYFAIGYGMSSHNVSGIIAPLVFVFFLWFESSAEENSSTVFGFGLSYEKLNDTLDRGNFNEPLLSFFLLMHVRKPFSLLLFLIHPQQIDLVFRTFLHQQ